MELVEFADLGLRDYKQTWDLQQQVLEKLVRAKTGSPDPDALPCLFSWNIRMSILWVKADTKITC